MSEELHHIKEILKESDSHLSYDLMERYIAGTLSHKEQHKVEKALLENDLLADALEGLRASRSNVAREKVMDIDEFVDNLVGTKEKKIPFGKITAIAAAALVLVVGSVALFTATNNTQMEMAKTESPATEKEIKKEVPVASKPTEELIEKEVVEEVEAVDDEIENIAEEAEKDMDEELVEVKAPDVEKAEAGTQVEDTFSLKETIAANQSAPAVERSFQSTDSNMEQEMEADISKKSLSQMANEMIAYNKLKAPVYSNSSYKNNKAVYGKDSYNDQAFDKSDQKGKTRKSEGKTKVNFLEEAIDAYNNGNFKSAASKFDFVLNSDPNNQNAAIYGGVAHLKSGNLIRAEELFKGLLSSSTYKDDATWFLVSLYLKLGKERKAKKHLRDLDESPKYGDKSKDILDELD